MKIRLSVGFSLLVSLSALAAPPAVTFDQTSAIVTLPAGHKVAWIKANGDDAVRSGVASDDDGDGVVRITPGDTIYSSWIIADAETGEWTTLQPEPQHVGLSEGGLVQQSILPGPDGAHSQLYVRLQMRNGGALWIRPGAGAWATTKYEAPVVLGRAFNFLIADVSRFRPLGASGPAPAGFARGDVLLQVTSGFAVTGIVDARLDDPQVAGRLEMQHPFGDRHPEGRETSVEVLRTIGTAGTITAQCNVPETSLYAVPGVDYLPAPPQLLTFAPGETVKRCTFMLLDDGVYSEFVSRHFPIWLHPVTGAMSATVPSYSVSIADDDPPPVITIGELPSTVLEGDTPWSLNVPWSLEGNFRGNIRIEFEPSPTLTSYDLTAGDQQRTSTVAIAADDVSSPHPRTIRVEISSSLGESRIQPVIRTITVLDDDDPAGRPVGWVEDIAVHESGGWTDATFTLRLSKAAATAVQVSYATDDASAKSGSDYEPRSGTVTFAPGETVKTIVVPVAGDGVWEETETFTVWLSNGNGVAIPDAAAVCTITDDDPRKRRTARH